MNNTEGSKVARIINLIASVLWMAMVPIAWGLGWFNSVPFISASSIYANFASHVAAWRSDANPNAEQLNRIESMLKEILAERT